MLAVRVLLRFRKSLDSEVVDLQDSKKNKGRKTMGETLDKTYKEAQGRGELTERIREKSKELFGYEINVRELRLIPYIHYVMTNEQKIDQNKVIKSELKILNKWEKAGYLTRDDTQWWNVRLKITKEFWDIMCEILYLSYVDVSY